MQPTAPRFRALGLCGALTLTCLSSVLVACAGAEGNSANGTSTAADSVANSISTSRPIDNTATETETSTRLDNASDEEDPYLPPQAVLPNRSGSSQAPRRTANTAARQPDTTAGQAQSPKPSQPISITPPSEGSGAATTAPGTAGTAGGSGSDETTTTTTTPGSEGRPRPTFTIPEVPKDTGSPTDEPSISDASHGGTTAPGSAPSSPGNAGSGSRGTENTEAEEQNQPATTRPKFSWPGSIRDWF